MYLESQHCKGGDRQTSGGSLVCIATWQVAVLRETLSQRRKTGRARVGSVVKTVLTAFADDLHQFLAPTPDSSLPPVTLAPRVLSPVMASVSIHTHRAFTHTDSDTHMLKGRWPVLEEWHLKLMSDFHMHLQIPPFPPPQCPHCPAHCSENT